MMRLATVMAMILGFSTAARANPTAASDNLEFLNVEVGCTHVQRTGHNLFGETEVSVSPRLSRHTALRLGADLTSIGVDLGAGGAGATIGVPTYLGSVFHGPYLEPSASWFGKETTQGMHAGWTFRSTRLHANVSLAAGVEVEQGYAAPQFAFSGQLRVGHAVQR